jgi:hypothetical protein
MQSASWQRRYPSNTPPQMLNFLLPLTPPILILEESCSKNLAIWPLGFFSHKLTDMESRYSTFDRELLAAFAIRHFRHFVKDFLSNFGLITNHL